MAWLRKYQILITTDSGTYWDVSDLHCTFNIQRSFNYPNYSEINVYNLTQATEAAVIKEGQTVQIYAGYEDGNYGAIFSGTIFQCIRTRENVTDYKVTLWCIDGGPLLNGNFVSMSFPAGASHREMFDNIATTAYAKKQINYVTENLTEQALARGKVIFGEPIKYLRQVAQFNNAQIFCELGQINITKITEDVVNTGTITYTPTTGLIGTPEQVDFGVKFKVLLDPRLRISYPTMLVKIDQTVILAEKKKQGDTPTQLDKDGLYQIIALDFIGDTRGNDWYTNITGVNHNGAQPLLSETAMQNPN